jgi:retron-type reverse transcriptase
LARLGSAGYRTWTLITASGKSRQIEDPLPNLKKIHARLSDLLSRIIAPQYLMCPVKGRSYISNAAIHREARAIVSLDIANYFPSTTARRVYWFFHQVMNCSTDVAGLLTALCATSGRLPTGSPASPLLSYFAHVSLWDEIATLCASHNCIFSLYVDDVTISGDAVPGEVVWKARQLVHAVGLRTNDKKQRRHENGRAEVTGVILDNGVFRVPKRGYRKLHLKKLQLSKAALSEERQQIRNAIRSIESQHAQVRSATKGA